MKNSIEQTCLGIITARCGSKGVPRKNYRVLGGVPVINYTIYAAKNCPYITRLVVTTDCKEIQSISIEAGAEAPFLRPKELATDVAKQEDAIMHAMEWYESRGQVFDNVCLLEPTIPLRQSKSLNMGFELLYSRTDADAVFSVIESNISPVFCNTLRPDGLMKDWMDDKYKWANRQEIPNYYQLSALVTISNWKTFKEIKSFLHDKTLALVVDPIEAKDIDHPIDFFVIEQLIERGYNHSEQLHDYVHRD